MSRTVNPYHYLPALYLWLDAADPFANEQASIPSSTDALSTWHDKSLNQHKFTATSGNEPVRSTVDYFTGQNNSPYIKFDGTEHMSCDFKNFPNISPHVFVVASMDNEEGYKVILSGVTASNARDFTFVKEKTGSTTLNQAHLQFKQSNGADNNVIHGTEIADNTPAIFEFISNSLFSFTFVDVNNTSLVQASSTASFLSTMTLNIAKTVGSAEAKVNIHEILIFSTKLLNTDRLAIQGYLKHKYNLPDSTLQPGTDTEISSGTARPFHPFISNPPTTNQTLTANLTSGETRNTPDAFLGFHKVSPRVPFSFIRLSLDSNDDNANATYGDGIENKGGIKQYYFSQEVGDDLSKYVPLSYPCLQSITPAAIEIKPTKGVAIRGNVTIKLKDFIRADDTVSFFSKFLAQNPFYLGRRIEIFEGYLSKPGQSIDTFSIPGDELQYFDGRREYIIDSMHLNKGTLTIKAKDPLTLGESLKSKVPTPSRYSLNVDIDSISSTPTIDVRLDGILQTSSILNASAEKFALFETTFGANGAVGHIRINEEIIKYTAIKTDSGGTKTAQLNITARGQWGTAPSLEHEIDDNIQQCLVIGDYTTTANGLTIDAVANELLINQAGISPNSIETGTGSLYSWTDERINWVSAFKINAILSEPKEVNKQLAELASMVGTQFFWDDMAAKIIMKAEAPVIDNSTLVQVTDDEILYESFSLFNSENERVSRVYYYYGLRDSTADKDKPKNYKNLYVNIDNDSESSVEYNSPNDKTIFAWGVKDTSTATSIAQRYIARFKKTPITCQFELDKGFDDLKTGDHFYLTTRHILNPDGSIKDKIEMQCLSVTYDAIRQINKIKAKSFRFVTTNLARITANDAGLFPAAGGGLGTADSPYTGVRATRGFISTDSVIATANGGTNSRQFITIELISPGAGYTPTNGTATFTQASGHIVGMTRGTGLVFTALISGGVIQSITAVTSNPASNSFTAGASHKGFIDPQDDSEILNLVGNSGSGGKIRCLPSAKMSTGGEPYLIV